VLRGERDGVFSNDGLSGRSVRSDEDRIAHFESINCFFLEVVQSEGVLEVVSCISANKQDYLAYLPRHFRHELVELHHQLGPRNEQRFSIHS
jgi:hypothetical protein